MTKRELIERIQNNRDLKMGDTSSLKQTERILDAALHEIGLSISKDRRLSLPGFGTFKVRARKERMGLNPQTKKPIKISARRVVIFKASPVLRDRIQ